MTDQAQPETQLADRLRIAASSLIPILVMMETDAGDHSPEALASTHASKALREELADALLCSEVLLLSVHNPKMLVDLPYYADYADHLEGKAAVMLPVFNAAIDETRDGE